MTERFLWDSQHRWSLRIHLSALLYFFFFWNNLWECRIKRKKQAESKASALHPDSTVILHSWPLASVTWLALSRLPRWFFTAGMPTLIQQNPCSVSCLRQNTATNSQIPSQAALCQVQDNRYAWGDLASKEQGSRDFGQMLASRMSGKRFDN